MDQEGYVTGYSHDGFGQQTELRRYAQRLNVAALAGWADGQPLSLAQVQAGLVTTAADRTIATRYDQRGLAVQVEQSQVGYYTSTGTYATGSPTVQVTYTPTARRSRNRCCSKAWPDSRARAGPTATPITTRSAAP
ncbi:hypothetical protein [Lysobacter capsici]|uniref:hypothetical protein n=1 Tax=Lysobacter capsici TaxID=435897 RepID=UPI00398CB8C1